MLTKSLLRYDQQGNRIVPFYISPKDSELLNAAASLIDIFQMSLGQTRAELEDSTKHIVNSYGALTFILRGFEKLLTDRLDFVGIHEVDFLERRQIIFQTSASFIRQSSTDLNQYRQKIAQQYQETAEQLSQQLYADLPSYQTVQSHRLYSPEQLIHRYNAAQIQGFLLKSKKLIILLPKEDLATLRRFCQYIRFYQLLAEIQTQKLHFKIIIDGPLAMFHQTQKYGLQLAQLFPAILLLPNWKLQADIHLSQQTCLQLKIDSSIKIRSHYRQFSAFVPDEIEIFAQHFAESISDWKIEPANEFIALKGNQYCFPDFRLTHQSGCSVALEFFHAWHSAPLRQRLKQVASEKVPPLILGVAKHLNKKDELGAVLKESPYFHHYGFLFLKTPTLDKFKKPLQNILKNQSQPNFF